MGFQSIVSGYIRIAGEAQELEHARQAIASYPFDDVYPFTNIFWCDSPARYHGPVVGFAGAYKQIEEEWSEWLWKFSQLLATLEADEAYVTLDCIMGTHSWKLVPQWIYETTYPRPPAPWPDSLVGQQWGIVEAPEEDFSIDPKWLAWAEEGVLIIDKKTGELQPYHWDRFVPRWLEEEQPA